MKIFSALCAALMLSTCGHSQQSAVVGEQAAPVESPVPAPAAAAPQPVRVAAVQTPPPGSLAARPEVQAFIREMVAEHQFDPDELQALFSRAESRDDIIELITRPAEGKPWHAYREIFLTSKRIRGGARFWQTYADALARAEREYGVPAEVIVAIIGVETSYGGNTGRHRVLEALATLAFDYPRRADFFRKELKHYLLLARDEGIDPLALKGSYAGAMGLAQFMPSSYQSYAVDFDGDGRRDLWTNPVDAIGSVANYLGQHRWRRGEPIASPARISGSGYRALVSTKLKKPSRSVASFRRQGVEPLEPVAGNLNAMLLELEGSNSPEYWLGFDNFYVITRYNHSPLYAMAVYQLSQAIQQQLN